MVLVDCGATSNFISKELMEELKLKVEDTPEYFVEVGIGAKVRNWGIYKHLNMKIQGVGVKQNFFILELEGKKVVLGMDWLAILGDIEANFINLILNWGG